MDVDDYHEGRKSIKSMLSNRKILLVLDDVSDLSQLENLARNQEWFGKGSLIIITTRDKHLLLSHGVSTWYDIKFLSDDESLELFHQNAFKGSKPSVDFLDLSRTVIHYASGLPLALKVLGSFLCGRNILEWRDAIARFKKVPPNNGILKILKVSFDGLEEDEKTIFLDIACFFKGMKKDYVMQILQKLDLHPIIGIKVLVDKSLVIISSDTVWVHDMLEEMAKNIVVQQSSHDAGKRSRIWSLEDANHVLESNMGTEAIRGIVLRLDKPYVSNWDPKAFIKMSNLKLLIIKSGWQWHADCFCYLNLPCGLKFFPSTLKVLEWKGCCLDTLPSPARKQPQVLGKLKHLDLSHSRYLIKTPNFDEVPDLEILILEGCVNVVEVHSSLGCHKNLATVNLKGCRSIKTLPRKFEMKRLETLTLSGCSKIKRLPEFGESMERLSQLDVEDTGLVIVQGFNHYHDFRQYMVCRCS
ncbi:disease resistance protein RUN1-like [Prosopis cineraria]|uniref:disease resistance protein RUN1-like n=1 Tax=Prosopis cineraria TaxID=364024 RepID=UPI00240F01DF|nr:disease resistance protein RUN1-like [Prosopis cineraria]